MAVLEADSGLPNSQFARGSIQCQNLHVEGLLHGSCITCLTTSTYALVGLKSPILWPLCCL